MFKLLLAEVVYSLTAHATLPRARNNRNLLTQYKSATTSDIPPPTQASCQAVKRRPDQATAPQNMGVLEFGYFETVYNLIKEYIALPKERTTGPT
jgi:hypothetical protein